MENINPILLQLAILIPFVAAFMLLCCKDVSESAIRVVASIAFAVPCMIAIYLSYQFYVMPFAGDGYFFCTDVDTGFNDFGISLKLGLNGISVPMFLLSGIVGLSAGLYALQSKADSMRAYISLLLFMFGGLLGVFASIDIFFFYFFHEFALIPTFIMVGVWGGQGRRSVAMEMTIYLTVGAMISLIGLISLYVTVCDPSNPEAAVKSFDFISLRSWVGDAGLFDATSKNIFALLMFGFGILVSLWPFHSWAPKGYAAAPSSAAMLHAGVLKKFGLYGLIQIAVPLLPTGFHHWAPVLIWLALGNIVIIGFVTMAQRDLKMMIGYASVMHMGYAFVGIAAYSVIGTGGVVLFMFAHGLSASLLFLLATSIYNRTRTYDMFEMGGLGQKAPVLAACFVAATMASIGLPGFANFWGELVIFISVWESYPWALPAVIIGVVISAVYGLRAVANIFFGAPTVGFKEQYESGKITDIRVSERLPVFILFAALVFVGFWPQTISRKVNEALNVGSYATAKVETTGVALSASMEVKGDKGSTVTEPVYTLK